jgi:hypothetical protein
MHNCDLKNKELSKTKLNLSVKMLKIKREKGRLDFLSSKKASLYMQKHQYL